MHIHFIDYARGFFGEVKWLEATAFAYGQGDSFRHGGTTLMEHESCPSVYIEFAMGFDDRPPYSYHILGATGLAEFADRKLFVRKGGSTDTIEQPQKDNLQDDTDNFIAQVLHDERPLRTWADTRRTMEVCLDCTRSARTGEKVVY
jgi:predicted dehydrogenase